ncbi:hypothetical protein Ancab_024110 [Ancistrocladus abbreviatus]
MALAFKLQQEAEFTFGRIHGVLNDIIFLIRDLMLQAGTIGVQSVSDLLPDQRKWNEDRWLKALLSNCIEDNLTKLKHLDLLSFRAALTRNEGIFRGMPFEPRKVRWKFCINGQWRQACHEPTAQVMFQSLERLFPLALDDNCHRIFFDATVGNGRSYAAIVLIEANGRFCMAQTKCHDLQDLLNAEAQTCAEAISIVKEAGALVFLW